MSDTQLTHPAHYQLPATALLGSRTTTFSTWRHILYQFLTAVSLTAHINRTPHQLTQTEYVFHITTPKVEAKIFKEAMTMKDAQAWSLLLQNCTGEAWELVAATKTAQDAWNALVGRYGEKGERERLGREQVRRPSMLQEAEAHLFGTAQADAKGGL